MMYFSNDTIDYFTENAATGQITAAKKVIEHELSVCDERKIAKLMRKAKFFQIKSFEGYDYSQVSFPQNHACEDLKRLDFIDAAQDFVFYGQTGRGKTHLAIAIGIKCVSSERSQGFSRQPNSSWRSNARNEKMRWRFP